MKEKPMKEKSTINDKISRFLQEQESSENSFSKFLSDIREGKKIEGRLDHIFPVIKDPRMEMCGFTDLDHYTLENLNEAEEFLQNEVFRSRLIESAQALLDHSIEIKSLYRVYSRIMRRIHRCMTLFYEADPQIKEFKLVLDEFFGGSLDENTVTIIRKTRVVDDWQKFLPNRVSEDDPARVFLRECSSKYDIAVCFPTDEEKQKMVEEFREGSKDARGKLEYAFLPAVMEVAADYFGIFGLVLDNISLGLEAVEETLDEYLSDPAAILESRIRERTVNKIEQVKAKADLRFTEKGIMNIQLEIIAADLADEEKRKARLNVVSDKTGISEEKIEEVLRVLGLRL